MTATTGRTFAAKEAAAAASSSRSKSPLAKTCTFAGVSPSRATLRLVMTHPTITKSADSREWWTKKLSNATSSEKAFQTSLEQGNYLDALRHWNKMRKSEVPPPVPVANVVESMQGQKMVTLGILHALKAYFERYPSCP